MVGKVRVKSVWQPKKAPPPSWDWDPWHKGPLPPLPAVDFGEVARLTPQSFQVWRNLLLTRIPEVWPGMTAQRAEMRVREFMVMPDCMLVHNNEAIGLARAEADPMDGAVVIRQIFMFSTARRHRAWNAMLRVYRHIEAWGVHQNAVRYEMEGGSDMDRGNLVDRCYAYYYDGAHRDLRKPK
jgi:hypothetical protein